MQRASADAKAALQSSEYKRQFAYGCGSFSARRTPFGQGMNPGLRSEEMITVGQYTPVLRTGSPRAGYTAG